MPPKEPRPPSPLKRADADRNRRSILEAARIAFVDDAGNPSMAEIARRAGVGMATLYRNFPGRRELLEALLTEDVDTLCAAANATEGADGVSAAERWLRAFAEFLASKHLLAGEILRNDDGDEDFLNSSRARVLAAGRPLIESAQQTGQMRADVSPEQVMDLVLATAEIRGSKTYVESILDVVMRGLQAT